MAKKGSSLHSRLVKSTNENSSNLDKLFASKLKLFQDEGKGVEGENAQKAIFHEYSTSYTVTAEDIKYGNKFVKVIEQKRKESPDGKVYFRNEYIDEIDLPVKPKLVFIKGAKNIGKTYGIAKYLERRLTENPKSQVMMVRTTRSEISKGFAAQLLGEEGPFTMQASKQKLIRKPGYLPERGESKKKQLARGKSKGLEKMEEGDVDQDEALKLAVQDIGDPDHCGYATYATQTGFSSFQGSGGKYLTDVIGDELNDQGQLTSELLGKFLTFLLSMERNNKDLRVWLYGNLLRRDDSTAADIALDHFKIPYDCNLKYGEIEKDVPALYINTGQAGELFDGPSEQCFTNMYGARAAADLNSNMPVTSPKVLNMASFLRAVPYKSFIYEMEEKTLIIYLGILPTNEEQGIHYIMHIEHYSNIYHYPGYQPVSDSMEVVNLFNAVSFKKPKRIAKIVKKIRKYEKRKKIFFSNDEVRLQGNSKISKRLLRSYRKELDGDI